MRTELKIATVLTGALALFLIANGMLDWDVLEIRRDEDGVVAFGLGCLAIWGGAFGLIWIKESN